jgi:thiamine-phosphate pyrophosphorylase
MAGAVPRLIAVATGADLAAIDAALAAVPRGALAIQLRDHSIGRTALAARLEALAPLCLRAGAPLVVNSHVDLAARAGAGVHLPEARAGELGGLRERLGGEVLLGTSIHAPGSAAAVAAAGASYAFLGPIWRTPGKERALGTEAIAAAVAAAPALPVIAIGGIDTAARVRAARAAGAHGVAGIRAFGGARVAELL